MFLDGDKKPCMVAFNWVTTSDVDPVTPVRVAIAPKSCSCSTPRVLARGITFPMAAASSGKEVWPSRTVAKDRSAAFCTASAEVSP